MLPLVTYGKTEASTTRSPSRPCTRIDAGSTTDRSSTPMAAVHDGCSAVSASARTQSRICSSVSTSRPGESSPSLYGAKAGWLRMSRATRIASTHSRRSVSRRQVVELHRRVHLGVGRADPHPAAGVGVHRADVDLVAVALGRRRAVVPDRDREEVEHQVRVGDVRRCCGRSRRPRSGWWRRGRAGGPATGRRCRAGPASAGRARWRRAASRRTGRRPRGGPGGSRRRRASGARRRCRGRGAASRRRRRRAAAAAGC